MGFNDFILNFSIAPLVKAGSSLMGYDNKTVWQFFVKTYGLFYTTLVATCWLSAQAVQVCMENQLTNPYVKSVA